MFRVLLGFMVWDVWDFRGLEVYGLGFGCQVTLNSKSENLNPETSNLKPNPETYKPKSSAFWGFSCCLADGHRRCVQEPGTEPISLEDEARLKGVSGLGVFLGPQ